MMKQINRIGGGRQGCVRMALYFIESVKKCDMKDCEAEAEIMDTVSGRRYCCQHAPKIWFYEARKYIDRLVSGYR